MPDIWTDCSKFVNRHICKILVTLTLGLFGSTVAGVTWYFNAQQEFGRLTQSTETRSVGNTEAIDALTGEVRKIGQSVNTIQGDIKVLKDRSDRTVRAGHIPLPYIAKPE